jgi:cellulose synthase/poly-beta-1,6-N-acetylglucosamine synthase-like glycosyltransferase
MELSVIIPTHNPHPGRLRRTLFGLRAQTLPVDRWETILVNNASTEFPDTRFFADCAPVNFSMVSEPTLGLSAARRHGFNVARGTLAVLVDDDNVLAPDYLEQVIALFARQPRVGVAGGKSVPEFERPPADWQQEFLPLLALRDLGPDELISHGLRPAGGTRNEYPAFAPIGAGMALRREAWTAWLDAPAAAGAALSDRRGGELTSAGDNDLVLCAMRAGWEAGYFPGLSLTHLIPASRLDADYLARLNRGIQKSWMQVLARHEASPWPPLTPLGAALRKAKAWFAHHPWSSPAARIRWQGACGHFDGRVAR